jgi:hypothetical protein
VLVASLDEGSVVWTKTPQGWSKPVLYNVARPMWVSEERAEPGELVYVLGFGLRTQYRDYAVVLKGGEKTLHPRTIVEARALRTTDKWLIYFEIPKDAAPTKYEVFCHHSYGGPSGWQKAGDLEITAHTDAENKVFDVRKFGAKGDGLANDREAITSAIAAAHNAGKGVVFLPPGTYLTDETILVPQHVRLCGANRESTVIRGFGDPLKANRVAWFHPLTPPTAVARLQSDTGLG